MVHLQVGVCAVNSLTITFDVFSEGLQTPRCFQQPILSVNSNAVDSYAFFLILSCRFDQLERVERSAINLNDDRTKSCENASTKSFSRIAKISRFFRIDELQALNGRFCSQTERLFFSPPQLFDRYWTRSTIEARYAGMRFGGSVFLKVGVPYALASFDGIACVQ
jgi:hypothetical protein